MIENPRDPKTLLLGFLFTPGAGAIGSLGAGVLVGEVFEASSGFAAGVCGMAREGRAFFDLSFAHHVPVHFGEALADDVLVILLLGALFDSKLSTSGSLTNDDRETISEWGGNPFPIEGNFVERD